MTLTLLTEAVKELSLSTVNAIINNLLIEVMAHPVHECSKCESLMSIIEALENYKR